MREGHLFTCILIHVCIALDLVPVAAQNPGKSSHETFEYLTTKHGLSSDKVEAVLQDHAGFYWIATQNGLNRFDGTYFKVFKHDPEDINSISHNSCTSLAEDGNGDIWVGTFTGVSRYVRAKGQFETIPLPHNQHTSETILRIFNLAYDGERYMWIAGYGLWRYDLLTDSITLFPVNTGEPTSLSIRAPFIKHIVYDQEQEGLWIGSVLDLHFYHTPQNQFYRQDNNPLKWKIFDHSDGGVLAIDGFNNLWFLDRTSSMLSMFNPRTNQIVRTDLGLFEGLNKIAVDARDRIWAIYWEKSAEIYDPKEPDQIRKSQVQNAPESSPSRLITNLYIDDDGNYWIPSSEGVCIYTQSNQYYKVHPLPFQQSNGTRGHIIMNAIAQTQPGSIWIGTNQGLYRYQLSSETLVQIPLNYPEQRVTAFYQGAEGLWMGVYDHLICLDTLQYQITQDFLLEPRIQFIDEGPDGALWVGTWVNGLYRIDLIDKTVSRFESRDSNANSVRTNALITGLMDDYRLWIGNNGEAGFTLYDFQTRAFSHFKPSPASTGIQTTATITAIAKAGKDYWLGTYGGGIFRYDPQSLTYENYHQGQGLKSNYINKIIADEKENLWISTADGLNFLNKSTGTIYSLDIDLVFPTNDYANSGIKGLDGYLYFFHEKEIIQINPEAFSPGQAYPKIVLSRFSIFDKERVLTDLSEVIHLSHHENFFSFEFSGIKTSPLKKVRYAYRLRGFDKDWIEVGYTPYAGYTNVPGGRYQFQIRATNEVGEWSDVLLQLDVEVHPPFWRTAWFIILCGLVIAGLIYWILQYRIRQIKKVYSVRTQISRDLHDDIGATLSTINIYSAVAETQVDENSEKAKELLKQISVNSRQVMEDLGDIVWANRTEHLARATLAGRIKNFGYDLLSEKNISCNYNIDPRAERKLSDPATRRNVLLIIKEALHNIAKYSQASNAEVHISLNHTHLLVIIRDNGIGFDPNCIRPGNGLDHMKGRAEAMGGSFVLEALPGHGTKIQCILPFPKNQH